MDNRNPMYGTQEICLLITTEPLEQIADHPHGVDQYSSTTRCLPRVIQANCRWFCFRQQLIHFIRIQLSNIRSVILWRWWCFWFYSLFFTYAQKSLGKLFNLDFHLTFHWHIFSTRFYINLTLRKVIFSKYYHLNIKCYKIFV